MATIVSEKTTIRKEKMFELKATINDMMKYIMSAIKEIEYTTKKTCISCEIQQLSISTNEITFVFTVV